MNPLNLQDVTQYVEKNIYLFHQKRLDSLEKLNLSQILLRKNPYLFRAKNLNNPGDIVKALLEAYISSSEETIFGDWLENLAIFINQKVYNGWKSGITGIDLEFDHEGVRYIVTIKSGPNWGNNSQKKKMIQDFKTAARTIRTSNANIQTKPVNGCCYGKDRKPDKGDYFKLCGQEFWHFVSGNSNFFIDIIEPLGYKARERNDDFCASYSKILTKFTGQFFQEYCESDGSINWEKIVTLNSGKPVPYAGKAKKLPIKKGKNNPFNPKPGDKKMAGFLKLK